MIRNWIFSPKTGNKSMFSITIPIQYHTGSLTRAIKQEIEIKGIETGKEDMTIFSHRKHHYLYRKLQRIYKKLWNL